MQRIARFLVSTLSQGSIGSLHSLLNRPRLGHRHRRGLIPLFVYSSEALRLERVSSLPVCEKLNPPACPADIGVEVEETFTDFCPFAEEQFPSPPCAASPKRNVTHIFHRHVAGGTIHNNTGLRSGFHQFPSIRPSCTANLTLLTGGPLQRFEAGFSLNEGNNRELCARLKVKVSR